MAWQSVATSWRSNRQAPGRLGGKFPAGRVLEFVYKRLEQQDHQKMRQQKVWPSVRLFPGGPFKPIRVLRRLNASSMRHRRR
jgi:hypothetical protein